MNAEAVAESAASTSILIVEDNPGYLKYLRTLLGLTGIEADVTEARLLSEAEKLMVGKRFSCVLMDLVLPNGQGQAAIEKLLRFAQPLVIVTAHEDEHTRKMAFRNGAQEYIEKSKLTHQILSRLIENSIDRGEGVGKLIAAYGRAKDESERGTDRGGA